MINNKITFLIAIFLLLFYSFSPILAYLPNDPKFNEQGVLSRIKTPQAWDMTKGNEDAIIAVMDSGVEIDHPDLKGNIWVNKEEIPGDGIDNDKDGYIDDVNGWDFVENKNDPSPKFSSDFSEAGINHGTIIAGLIAARGDNGEGIIGVCPRCKIMPLRVLDNQGSGNTGAVIDAINYAIDKGADIINMSFVGDKYSVTLAEAVKKAYQAGITMVAASGNDSLTEGDNLLAMPLYPVCYDGDDNYVIGVAALNNKDEKAIFSNYGEICMDISAPGTSFYSTQVYYPENNLNDYYAGYWSGTSVATALVSGVAGLIKSVNSLFSPKQIREIIINNSDNIDYLNPLYQGKLGAGKLNAYRAVSDAYVRMAAFSYSSYIITGAGTGGGPHIRNFNSNGFSGEVNFFAYDKNFRGGVNVASGDIDGDGKAEIITGAGIGGGPQVRVFNDNARVISQFFAFAGSFRGGVKVAVGDLDGDRKGEIITGIASSANAYVRIFDRSAHLRAQFLAYPKNFQGGLNLACGDLNLDGKAEIITGAGFGGSPQVRIFDSQGNVSSQFFAYNKNFRGGVNVGAINIR